MGLSSARIVRHGIPDHWIIQDSRKDQLAQVGLDADGIARMIRHTYAPSEHACFIAKPSQRTEPKAAAQKPSLGV
jgi:phage gp16-like protein